MKSFVSFLYEMPQINTHLSKSNFAPKVKQLKDGIVNLPHKQVASDIFHHNSDGRHFYFNKDNDNKVNDISIIDKNNNQISAHKDGKSNKNIHNFMIHHAETHGIIRSDKTNTEGSKHLWISLIKSKPKNKSFHIINTKTNEEEPITAEDIPHKENKIWGSGQEYSDVKLEMRHHDD